MCEMVEMCQKEEMVQGTTEVVDMAGAIEMVEKVGIHEKEELVGTVQVVEVEAAQQSTMTTMEGRGVDHQLTKAVVLLDVVDRQEVELEASRSAETGYLENKRRSRFVFVVHENSEEFRGVLGNSREFSGILGKCVKCTKHSCG